MINLFLKFILSADYYVTVKVPSAEYLVIHWCILTSIKLVGEYLLFNIFMMAMVTHWLIYEIW